MIVAGACAKAWPPYFAPKGALSVGAGVKRALLGTVKRTNGRRQATYAGRPIYYYVGDKGAGQILCQDVFEYGGRWLIVRPSGKLVRRAASWPQVTRLRRSPSPGRRHPTERRR